MKQTIIALGCAILTVACGTGQERLTPDAISTLTAQPSPFGTGTVSSTSTPAAGTVTPVPGLTDTGYLAPDGSPLYAECIGPDETGKPLPLPPSYPSGGMAVPIPTPPLDPNPNPKPSPDELPTFDVLKVARPDASGWRKQQTLCLGGISFAVPLDWTILHPLTVGGYRQGAGASFRSANELLKVDFSAYYTTDDQLARREASSAGNGVYFLDRNVPIAVNGATGLVTVSSEIVEEAERHVGVSYLIQLRPNWYVGMIGLFHPPYDEAAFGAFIAAVETLTVGTDIP